jgi:hypothetical protein
MSVGRRLVALVLVAVASGCDEDRGPGTVQLTVAGDTPLGAVVVELTGSGIRGVDDLPGAWLEMSPVEGAPGGGVHRLVVVLQEPGAVEVGIQVADLDDRLPRARVVQASGPEDQLLASSADVQATVRR